MRLLTIETVLIATDLTETQMTMALSAANTTPPPQTHLLFGEPPHAIAALADELEAAAVARRLSIPILPVPPGCVARTRP